MDINSVDTVYPAVDVVCLGELLIDFVSLDREASIADSSGFRKAPGGAPANVAAGIVRQGRTAGFIGKVGSDPFGHYLANVLKDEGVDVSCLAFDPDARTTLAFVALKSGDAKDIMFYRNPGADMLLSPGEVPEKYLAGAKIFHFGSISLGSPDARAATLKALEYAKAHGLLVSYDPNLRLSLWNDEAHAKDEINAGFAYADVVKISEEEFGFITGCGTPEECAEYVLERGPRLAVVTLGGKGCYYSDGSRQGHLEGFEVDTVETTGAGDAFAASMLCGLLERLPSGLEKALRADDDLVAKLVSANASGALATTKYGAIPSLPTEAEVRKFLDGCKGYKDCKGSK